MSHKVQEVDQFQKPHLESEYNHSSSQFAVNRQPARQMQNEHSFTFSAPSKAIDNSHLQQAASSKFNDTQQIINEAKVNNLGVGREVIGKVREEGSEGVVLGVAEETVTNGEKVFREASDFLREDKK
jgi:hypothetical protein